MAATGILPAFLRSGLEEPDQLVPKSFVVFFGPRSWPLGASTCTAKLGFDVSLLQEKVQFRRFKYHAGR